MGDMDQKNDRQSTFLIGTTDTRCDAMLLGSHASLSFQIKIEITSMKFGIASEHE